MGLVKMQDREAANPPANTSIYNLKYCWDEARVSTKSSTEVHMMLVCHVIVNWRRWTSVTQELLLGSLPHQSQVSDKVTYAVRINHKPYKFKGKYFNGTTTNECSFDTLKSELSEIIEKYLR